MKTKKILMVTSFYPPYHVGGACTHVYYLANELAKLGHEVHVLFSEDSYYLKRSKVPDEKTYPNHKNVILHKIKTPPGKLTPLFSYVTGIIPFNKKIKEVFEQEFDIIHYHNISLFGPQIFQYGKGKKIFTAHDHWFVCPLNDFFSNGKLCGHCPTPLNCSISLVKNKRPIQLWRFTDILKRALKEIDFIISPSEYLMNFYKKYSIDKKFVVLPNFTSSPPKKTENTGYSDFFFYAGMLEEFKGIKILLEAFRDSDKKLLIAGKGSMEQYVKDFISKSKLEKQIIYLGFVPSDQIFSYFKDANAFILPSQCPENCPNTIIEALSVGTPSIGSNRGGIPDLIAPVDRNLIFENIEELKKILANFENTKYDSKKLKGLFQERHSAEKYIQHYLELVD